MRLVLSKKRAANLRVSSFMSQYQLVVNCRPSVLRRPRLCTSVRKISRPAICMLRSEEAGSEFACFIVHVPVPTGGELQALGVAQAQAVHVGQEDQQTGDLHA